MDDEFAAFMQQVGGAPGDATPATAPPPQSAGGQPAPESLPPPPPPPGASQPPAPPAEPETRKRKSRWGDPAPAAAPPDQPAVRKSRWGPSAPEASKPANPLAALALSNPALAQALGLQASHSRGSGQGQGRINDIFNWLQAAKLPDAELNRSPSPEPIYDKFGKRTNTRDMRVRERLMKERYELIENEMKTDSSFRPPQDFKPGGMKKIRRVGTLTPRSCFASTPALFRSPDTFRASPLLPINPLARPPPS